MHYQSISVQRMRKTHRLQKRNTLEDIYEHFSKIIDGIYNDPEYRLCQTAMTLCVCVCVYVVGMAHELGKGRHL